jgi:AcrR family transcriptional regulator
VTLTLETTAAADGGVHLDGRSRRRLNSFERAVDALLDLIEAGNATPTAQQIADRSGISVRTVFRLTEDNESLHAAAIRRQAERTAHLYVSIPSEGDLPGRVRALIRTRVTLFEAIAPVRRVAEQLAAGSAPIAEGLEMHQLMLRAQVAEVFEPELSALPRSKRADALHAAEVAAGWATWDQLRRTMGLSAASSARIVKLLLDGVLQD